MNVKTSTEDPATFPADWLAVGLFEDQDGPPPALAGRPIGELLGRLLAAKEVGTVIGEVALFPGDWGLKAGSLAIFGLGTRAKFDAGSAFSAGVAVSKRLAGKPRDAVAVVMPDANDPARVASALLEGLIVGTRGPGLRKTEPNRHSFGTLTLIAPGGNSLDGGQLEAAARRGEVVGRAINEARDLVNTPPSEKTPTTFAGKAVEARADGVEVTVWDAAKLRDERFGGLLGVALGSDEPPVFVRLDYRKGGDAPTLALVGKGVTFDSGGLSLKPSASMEDMKSDMTGAAVVLAAIRAVARLELPVNLVGYLALTENMTGGRALKLGDVLTMRDGQTVEVLNTDAEGRLILADALSYAVEQTPARIIDLATLTGACLAALGTRYAGLFSNDDEFAAEVTAAGKRTGERTWRLPLDDDFRDAIKSGVADMKNIGGKWGGAITAAKFLEQFVGSRPWVHLDIAGPSWSDADSSTRDPGGTGCFVRTLVELIEASVRSWGRAIPGGVSTPGTVGVRAGTRSVDC